MAQYLAGRRQKGLAARVICLTRTTVDPFATAPGTGRRLTRRLQTPGTQVKYPHNFVDHHNLLLSTLSYPNRSLHRCYSDNVMFRSCRISHLKLVVDCRPPLLFDYPIIPQILSFWYIIFRDACLSVCVVQTLTRFGTFVRVCPGNVRPRRFIASRRYVQLDQKH